MLLSQSRTAALDTITVQEIQPCRPSHLEQEYPELGEDAMEELARGIIAGEVLSVCRSMDRTLYKLADLFTIEGTTHLAVILEVKVISFFSHAFASSPNLCTEAAAAKSTDQGIISAAIAEAAASPTTPVKGQENKSLLEQQSSKNSSSAKTQFTFICESDSAKSMVWPPDIDFSPSPSGPYSRVATNSTGPHQSQNGRGFATQGTQTSPNMASQTNQAAAQQTGANQQAPQQTKKPRRPLHKQYALAARNRRTRQEMNNYKNPPKEEDVWICEFCEYESIFHEPPKALIRQYEAKDRLERKRLAEKQRLLEKAKMKGRKGKKGNKKNANAATHAQPPAQKSRYGQQPMDEILVQQQGTQSEEYVLDDYDDDPIPMPALPTQTPSKIPQPVSQNYNQSLRPSSSSGGVKGNIGADRKAYS